MLSGLLVVAASLVLSGPAVAFEMTRTDRLAVLYSDQVVFDRQGEPLVSVRLTERQAQVVLTSKGRMTLLPGGDDGARIRARKGAKWTVRLEDARPAEVRWWTIVEHLPAGDLDIAAEARQRWQRAGHTVKILESGAVIGLSGTTLDTRRRHVGIDHRPTRAAALERAGEVARSRGLPQLVMAELVKRPGGWIVARDKRSGFEVRARDLLWFQGNGKTPITLPDMEWGHGTPKRGRADRSYDGDIYVTVDQTGALAAVNVLSAEGLLEGVVPSELFPSAPEAALRAQAVAARGQLLAKVGTRHRADPYLLCAETHCQVYSGETRSGRRTDAAVRETRGQLLFDGQGLVDTTYSSACGGHSEAFHQMWGGPPKGSSPGRFDTIDGTTDPLIDPAAPLDADITAVVARFVDAPPEAWCKASATRSKVYRWTKTRTGAQVTKAVRRHAGRDIGAVHTIRPMKRGVSGRALVVEYLGTAGRHVVEGSYENRKLLGKLRSGMWVVERTGGKPGQAPDRWNFRGGGFGHGVGLCQHGAIGQARAGRDHDTILRHYYPGSRIETAW